MARKDDYVDLDGVSYPLSSLDSEERALIDRCKQHIEREDDWYKYSNFWMPEVNKLYSARGLSRREITKTVGWRIAQDLGGRLMVAKGLAVQNSDYRDELDKLIKERYRSRREFCKLTGISEDMLSHLLAKRKHLAVGTLADALGRIGYGLHIAPLPEVK